MTTKIEIADTFIKKIKGLMFEKKPKMMLFINKKYKIHVFHTIFMNFNLDFFFLDENNKIIGIFRDVRPNMTNIRHYSKDILEAASSLRLPLEIGDYIYTSILKYETNTN